MQKNKNFFPVFLILLILALFLFVLSSIGFLNGLSGLVEVLSTPLQKATFGIVHVSKIADKQKELKTLKEENIGLIAQTAKQQELKRENQALRDQFQTTNPSPKKLLPADIVGMTSDRIVIDKGQVDGLKTGNIVIFKDNLIGKIAKVSAHLSVADFITRDNTSTTAYALKTQAQGVLKGGNSLILDNVVLSDKLENGDLVVTKGDIDSQGRGFPPNLVVGKIVSVNKKASSLFQNAEVKSLIDFEKLEMVFVIVQ